MNKIDHDDERRYEERKDELRAAYLRKHKLFDCLVCGSEVAELVYSEIYGEFVCAACSRTKE